MPPVVTSKLATLKPGMKGDSISLSLKDANLAEGDYCAISYDRSKKGNARTIDVDDTTLTISSALHEALENARSTNEPLHIWTDALSSSAPEERSLHAQTSRVALQHAREVLGSLDLGDDRLGAQRINDAFKVMHTIAGWWHDAAARSSFPGRIQEATQQQFNEAQALLHSHDMEAIKPKDAALWHVIERIFSATYFRSPHTLPDIVLAQKMFIRFGSHLISWDDFQAVSRAYPFLVPVLYSEFPLHMVDALEQLESINTAVRRQREGQRLELLPMIHATRHCSSEVDPREMIFALLPIIGHSARTSRPNGQRQTPPSIDYEKTTSEVFEEAAIYIIQERQDFLLWYGEVPPCGRRMQGMPSWAPDWTTQPERNGLAFDPNTGLKHWADNVSDKRVHVDEKFALHVQAHYFDRLEYVSSILTEENYRGVVAEAWKACCSGNATLQAEKQASTNTMTATFARALVLDQSAYPGAGERLEAHQPSQDLGVGLQSLLAEERVLRSLNCTMEELNAKTDEDIQNLFLTNEDVKMFGPYMSQNPEFAQLVLEDGIGRRFFRTQGGMMGMTAVETPADSPVNNALLGEEVPSTMDEALRDPFQRAMLEAFQRDLAEKKPEAFEGLAKSMMGRLPGQTAPGARAGDIVVALQGGIRPYVLRALVPPKAGDEPVLRSSARCTLVGDCHVQGVMNGECFQTNTQAATGTQWRKDVGLVDIVII